MQLRSRYFLQLSPAGLFGSILLGAVIVIAVQLAILKQPLLALLAFGIAAHLIGLVWNDALADRVGRVHKTPGRALLRIEGQ